MVATPALPVRSTATPCHVAIIMDGNGRWAEQRGLPRLRGHQAGIEPVRATVEYCARRGVEALTLFAFSSENWRRPADEVRGLMALFAESLASEVEELDANKIRVRFIGDRAMLTPSLDEAICDAEKRTATNSGMQLVIAVAYGGRWDVVQAARRLAEEAKAGRVRPEDIDEELFAGALETRGIPDVDLLIRTGGEQRISNFLLWNVAYSELFFCDRLWPELGSAELDLAFEYFARRQRRFGRTGRQIEVANC